MNKRRTPIAKHVRSLECVVPLALLLSASACSDGVVASLKDPQIRLRVESKRVKRSNADTSRGRPT
jgi:hypothetical protein